MIAMIPRALLKLVEGAVRLGEAPPSAGTAPIHLARAEGFSTAGRPSDAVLPSLEERLDRAQGYVTAMPASIEGANGSRALFLAAAAAVRGFCLGRDKALEVLEACFNPRCQPAWSRAELLHKIDDASRARDLAWAGLMPGIGLEPLTLASDACNAPLGEEVCHLAPPATPTAPTAQPSGRGASSWQTSSPITHESVVVRHFEARLHQYFIGLARETDADHRPFGALVFDRPLDQAGDRWLHVRRALGLQDGSEPTAMMGKRFRIEYNHTHRRVGRVYPPIADNRARWQVEALSRVRELLPEADPLRRQVEGGLKKGFVPWSNPAFQSWWKVHGHPCEALP